MVKLIWARHAVTHENQAKRYIGHYDAKLSETGREQAAKLAEVCKDFPLSAIYTSDLERAFETASTIATHHRALMVEACWELRELSFGEWEAKTYEEIQEHDGAALIRFYDDPWNNAPTNGETLADIERRLDAFLAMVMERHVHAPSATDQTILAVSHGGMIKLFLTLYIVGDKSRYFEQVMKHGEHLICRYDREQGSWQLCT